MTVEYGTKEDISSWMKLVSSVSWNFPGLETEEKLKEHETTVLRFMSERRALCVKEENAVVGVLLFSKKHNMICCLTVSPDFRRLYKSFGFVEGELIEECGYPNQQFILLAK